MDGALGEADGGGEVGGVAAEEAELGVGVEAAVADPVAEEEVAAAEEVGVCWWIIGEEQVRISIWSSGESSSSASSERIHCEVHFSMAEFFWAEKPFQGSEKTLALKEAAISRVRSVEPESMRTISSAKRDAGEGARRGSALR